MSNYDVMPKGSQVKCWSCELKQLKAGSEVGTLGIPCESYVVLLREGGYVRIESGVITEIVEDNGTYYPEDFGIPCFDKWGKPVASFGDLMGRGIMDEGYYFRKEEEKSNG